MAGDKDDGHFNVHLIQFFLQFQAAHTWHTDIQYQAVHVVQLALFQKSLRVRISDVRDVDGFQQHADGIAHRLIIIDYVNLLIFVHSILPTETGLKLTRYNSCSNTRCHPFPWTDPQSVNGSGTYNHVPIPHDRHCFQTVNHRHGAALWSDR